jgi:hypothetical protein
MSTCWCYHTQEGIELMGKNILEMFLQYLILFDILCRVLKLVI